MGSPRSRKDGVQVNWSSLLLELLPLLASGFGFIRGFRRFFRNGVALYLQLIVCALGCFMLGKLFGVISFFTVGGLPEHFHVGYLGTFGCFMFLFSANFGQMDGLIDDGSKATRKYRFWSLSAPGILTLGMVPLFFSPASVTMQIVTVIVLIPALLSSYFNLKHLIFPDMGFGFVKAIRPCNFCALALAVLCQMELISSAWQVEFLHMAVVVLLSLVCILLIFAAERGTKLWRT